MNIGEIITKWAIYFIIIFIGILTFIFLFDQLTGSNLTKNLLCSIFFIIPFGSIFTALTQACNVIPA
ncbi:MAG: hypothetical protein QXD43_06145 [Candidatus Aenigmatarchaeota archaeon]